MRDYFFPFGASALNHAMPTYVIVTPTKSIKLREEYICQRLCLQINEQNFEQINVM